MVVIRMRDEEGRQIETIASLSGMSKTRPGLALAFMAFMFSLAGIPPLFGFYPKLAVFNAAVAAGLFPLAVLAVVGSVIGVHNASVTVVDERSEEHTSELQSLMRISYAVFC